jgi:release factor glutamine methyltransferase
MVSRRVAGEPVEAIVGWAAFHGLRIVVAPGVFVPRRRTELLVREAISIVQWQLVGISPDRQPIPTGLPIVELCCGTAAVATAIRSGVSGELELYDALPTNLRGRIDLLVANAPYVPSAEIAMMPPEARDHEPRVALDGGADGLDVQRRIIDRAREWLAPGGHLLVETSRRQAPSTVASCAAAGLAAQVVTDDELDATVVVAVAP